MSHDDHGFDAPPPPPSEEELRAELLRFARGILRLEEEGRLLASPADLQTVLGELRRRLFEWEVRRAAELGRGASGSGGGKSDQVVREAREAEEAFRRNLDGQDSQDSQDSQDGWHGKDDPDDPDESDPRGAP